DNVRQELLALVKDLPSLLSEIGAGASALSEAIELYQACVEFVCESSAELVVPLLRHVGKRGNTTVYEWRMGLQPLRVERPGWSGRRATEGGHGMSWPAGAELWCWGEPQPLCPVSVRLFAPEVSGGLLSFSPQIDWGDFILEPTRVDDGPAADGGAQEIDWGITLEPGPQVRDPWLCVPECPPPLSPQLELFLSQRLVEMEEEADIVAVSQFAVLQGQTSAHVGSLLATTRALLGQLCTRSMQHLFMILASPR
ncbi:CDK5 regulatory subunit-associated protein 3, partial [Fulmarus glacialis]